MHQRDGSEGWLVMPPVAARKVLVEAAHSWGHTGINKMVQALNTTFWWPGLTKTVKEVVGGCMPCKQQKLPVRVPQELSPMTIPTGPWKVVCMDVVTFISSTGGNRYVVVAQDWFSKWVELRPIPDKKSATVATFFREEILYRVGCPRVILTDQGGEFKGMMDEVLRLCCVKHRVTSPYSPQANGLVERFNRTLIAALRASMDRNDLRSWEQGLGNFVMAYRGFPHALTRISPYKLIKGYDMPLPWELPEATSSSARPGARILAGLHCPIVQESGWVA